MIFALIVLSLTGVCMGNTVPALGLPGASDVYDPSANLAKPPTPDQSQVDLTTIICSNSNASDIVEQKNIINALYNWQGQAQCKSLDHVIGAPVYSTFSTWWYGEGEGVDFGGKAVCDIDCEGECVPYQSVDNGAPVSAYPWGCKCTKQGCSADKKVWKVPGATSRCQADASCANYCKTIDPQNPNYSGQLCNWLNPSGDNKNAFMSYDTRLSPIRWCECCPQ